MCYDVSLNQRFWNDNSVSDQDAPAVRHVVYHHHNARLLTVHHAKCAATHKKKTLEAQILRREWDRRLRWYHHSQWNAAFRGQAEHHFSQGGHAAVVAVFEGGQCSRFQAADLARRGTKLRRGARTQLWYAEVREHFLQPPRLRLPLLRQRLWVRSCDLLPPTGGAFNSNATVVEPPYLILNNTLFCKSSVTFRR